jgi:hypothetical protein
MHEHIEGVTNSASRSDLRRVALVSILEGRAEQILERVVTDALRATDFVGLGRGVAVRYAETARASLPLCLAALGAPDPERGRICDVNAHLVKDLVRQGIPKFVQRSLMSFGFRAASGIVREAAHQRGFEPDELDDELRVFQRAFEARLFYSA